MLLRGNIAVYSKNHVKPLNTLCDQNAVLLKVKVRDMCPHYARVFKELKLIN